MGKISLLDCTLRDGGYVNDWMFGEDTIKGFCKKIIDTGIEILEVGFIKGDTYNPDRGVFPDVKTIKNAIPEKSPDVMYVGMADMSSPVPFEERFLPKDKDSIDGVRVIFKKSKMEEAYSYCKKVKDAGYVLFVQFVGTDSYSDKEFIEAIEKFNTLEPYAISIVDSFGMIKRKQFLRLVYLADNNMKKGITLGYHAHNNLQQAYGNAEALVELGLQRDICIDACVFGMGRGAGNLNMELFAEYLNESHGKDYKIEPMLEIMDEYLSDIYKKKFWGYSLPLYLSASCGVHPNYAIYLAEKDSLSVKAFNELLHSISREDKAKFSKDKAESYYKKFLETSTDDSDAIDELTKIFLNRNVLLLAPGKTIRENKKLIGEQVDKNDCVVLAVNFAADSFNPDFVFSSNIRRYSKIEGKTGAKCIVTSNLQDISEYDYKVNFASFSSEQPDIIDNAGLMALKLLKKCNVNEVIIAGMDGYSVHDESDYYDKNLEYDFSSEAERRNNMISDEIRKLKAEMKISFITPTKYDI